MSATYELDLLDDDSRPQRNATLAGRVFQVLRRSIVQLRFLPGNPLSEAEIARQLGISRQPVREAFIKLDEAGLVEIRPQRGTYVRLISVREVANAQFIREAVEVEVARRAAGAASGQDIAALRAVIDRQRAMAAAGDNPGFLALDERFHQLLAASSGHEDAWRVLEDLKAQMDRVRFLSLPEATPLDTLIAQHASIVDAVEARARDAAAAAVRLHLSEILISLPKLAAAHPALFTE